MSDREIIKKILYHSIIYVGHCDAIEKKKLYKIIVKLSGVKDRLSNSDILITSAFFMDEDKIFHCSKTDYPLEYCDDSSEENSILLFSEDIYELNKIYLKNKNDLSTINKIIKLDINSKIRYKKQLLLNRIKDET